MFKGITNYPYKFSLWSSHPVGERSMGLCSLLYYFVPVTMAANWTLLLTLNTWNSHRNQKTLHSSFNACFLCMKIVNRRYITVSQLVCIYWYTSFFLWSSSDEVHTCDMLWRPCSFHRFYSGSGPLSHCRAVSSTYWGHETPHPLMTWPSGLI